MAKSTFNVPSLVDAFVAKINREPREPQPHDEVPEFLRERMADDAERVWTSWKIVKRDNSARIDELQCRIGRPFPPSFQYLLSNYCFPAFESGPLMLFANTGEEVYWELGRKLFIDPSMSPQLLRSGFIQIGNPFFYNYDPVCFDCGSPRVEKRIVQLDHEAILVRCEVTVVKETASSFLDIVQAALA